ncbi:MAG TPA: hypothetical protein VK427_15900 [Kofleriaceae bacterium]|nr:hypothetical protein [Kofleriaceae bacterium]
MGILDEADDDRALARACLERSPDALSRLDAEALVPAGVLARTRGLPEALVDDALQIARVRLVLGEGDRSPGLASYRGRGSLAAFVRTAVLRIAIDLTRRDRETPDEDIEAMLADGHIDPELELMRTHYAGVLRDALRAAWQALAAHDRFVLGLQLHEKLDLDAIAKLYQVHRATAARRAATARASLVALAREQIRTRCAVGDTTVDSILRIVTTSVAWSALAAP